MRLRRGLKNYKLPYKIYKIQGYIVYHKEYSQYFITLNGVQSENTVCFTPQTNIKNQPYFKK